MPTNPTVVSDILELLRTEDQSAKSVHRRLQTGGHLLTLECVYEGLVHLEAMELVRIAPCSESRLWGAL